MCLLTIDEPSIFKAYMDETEKIALALNKSL